MSLIGVMVLVSAASAEPKAFRIGTGGSGGTYLPIGSLIAEAISGTSDYHRDYSFYEPELVAVAQRSTGSASNVTDVSEGLLEAGLAQADVVHWAYTGTGPFDAENPRDNLRGLATLYLESVHLIVRNKANINNISDLVGQRVSLDEIGSGTRLDILPILDAFQVSADSFNAVYLKPSDAIDRIRKDELDAFFIVAGYPVSAVSKLVDDGQARVIPISGPPIDNFSNNSPYFSTDIIPANTYQNEQAIKTLGVPAQLIINSEIGDELAYNITSMLWSSQTLNLLRAGHPKGNDVALESALVGMELPLHPGAERFYREAGLFDE